MKNYQRDFFDLAIQAEVLRFGEFTLKSGRISPYFFNAGLFNTGSSLSQLGSLYADAIQASGLDFDMLYGPAYKGIPLAAAIAIALHQNHGLDLPYAFNRKEAKDHGEGGVIVGAPINGRVLIVDDVISAGTSVRESIDIINENHGLPVGVGIALDRQERGQGEKSAVQEVQYDHQLQVISIAGIADLIEYLEEKGNRAEELANIKAYRDEYGIDA